MKFICKKCNHYIELDPTSISDNFYEKNCEFCSTPFLFYILDGYNSKGSNDIYAGFLDNKFSIRKKIIKFLGDAFYIYNSKGDLVFYINQKGLKLKENIRVYTNDKMLNELLIIQAKNIIDFSSAYDIIDANTGKKIGGFKRRGFKSIIRDEWIIMDEFDRDIGVIKEDNKLLSIIRRFIIFFPQRFIGIVGNKEVFYFKQRFNPFIFWMDLDFTIDRSNLLDRRMGIAAAILLSAIK